MKGWELSRLSDLCEVFPGYAFDSSKFTSKCGDVHLVKGENLHQGYIDWIGAKKWPVEELEKFDKYRLIENDIVVAMDRPWIEAGLKCSYIRRNEPEALLVQRVSRLRAFGKLDQDFLKHVISSELFEAYIKTIVTGVNVPHVSGSQIGNFKFLLPKYPVQRKIAAVLSAYDDLIENNNRRIALLEKMAEELYREWFVRLRFPGHEQVKIVKGVPEGWEVKDAHSLLTVLGGGTPKTDVAAFWDGEIPFFTPKDSHCGYFVNHTEKYITRAGLENCNSKLYLEDTIFITARGTVGNIVLSLRPMAMNQSCYALEPKSGNSKLFYFLALRDAVETIKSKANSGVFDNIITDSFKNINLIIPADEVLIDFCIKVNPVFIQIKNLIKTISIIEQSRDRLLSRLMSGKIDVEQLDIKFPASMLETDCTADAVS